MYHYYIYVLCTTVKRCPRLRPPNNGVLVCTPQTAVNQDFPFDAECKFSCYEGSHLVGSPARTCLPLARWDGLPTTCKRIYLSFVLNSPTVLKGCFIYILLMHAHLFTLQLCFMVKKCMQIVSYHQSYMIILNL